jgi:alginate O-acetyltransferase complex protein AlgI
MSTMMLGGLWHGAAWSYAVWGCFHGAALAVERFLADKVRLGESWLWNLAKGFAVFGLVTMGWLLFKLPHFNQVIEYLKTIVRRRGIGSPGEIFYILLYSSPIAAYHAAYLLKKWRGYRKINKMEFLAYGGMIFMIITNSGSPGAFIYFQF